MANQEVIDGFVLAGGKSSRMGQDKALMQLEGTPLVLRAAEILRPFVRQIALLAPADRYSHLGLPVVADKWPDQGPLGAICTGSLSSRAEWCIFLACDLPLVSRQFIQLLIERVRTSRFDAVVPRTADGWQPLSAAYHSRCRAAFERAMEEGRRSIVGLLDEVRVEAITHDEMISAGLREMELTNINTTEDWARIAELTNGDR
ncbi:MAG: molybdenum cofactor guanylyltransferase [Terriglobia bacterium]